MCDGGEGGKEWGMSIGGEGEGGGEGGDTEQRSWSLSQRERCGYGYAPTWRVAFHTCLCPPTRTPPSILPPQPSAPLQRARERGEERRGAGEAEEGGRRGEEGCRRGGRGRASRACRQQCRGRGGEGRGGEGRGGRGQRTALRGQQCCHSTAACHSTDTHTHRHRHTHTQTQTQTHRERESSVSGVEGMGWVQQARAREEGEGGDGGRGA
eukprot:3628915-Rhodomonas_salina.1